MFKQALEVVSEWLWVRRLLAVGMKRKSGEENFTVPFSKMHDRFYDIQKT